MPYMNCEGCGLDNVHSWDGTIKLCNACKAKQSATRSKRGKQVFTTDEIPHLWAHKVQSSARNHGGNLYFQDSTIYSYRDSFPIASHVTGKAKGSKAILVTNDSYSVTTSGHISSVKRAIPRSIKVFTVAEVATRLRGRYVNLGKPNQRYIQAKHYTPNNDANVKDYLSRIDAEVRKAAKAIKNGPWHREQAETILRELREYCEFFGVSRVKFPVIPADLSELKAQLRAEDKKKNDARKARELADKVRMDAARMEAAKQWMFSNPAYTAKWDGTLDHAESLYKEAAELERAECERLASIARLERLGEWMANHPTVALDWDLSYSQGMELQYAFDKAEAIAKWLAGDRVNVPYDVPTMLRVLGDEVETSKGARIPVSHARRVPVLLDAVIASGEPWIPIGKTCRLGHYEIDKIDSDGTIHAGCHVIPYSAIQRIRPQVMAMHIESEDAS